MHRLADDGPRDLVVALRRRLDSVPRLIVEAADVAHHTHRLVERTKPTTDIMSTVIKDRQNLQP